MTSIRISLVVDLFYQNNQIFNESNQLVNRDDCMRPWIELRKVLAVSSISIDTVDIRKVNDSDIVFFINIPDENDLYLRQAIDKGKKIFCAITELYLIHNANIDLIKINNFERVFTYQTNLVNNKHIFKLNYSFDFVQKANEFTPKPFKDKEFSTMICGNKSLDHDNELYSERINIIRWYENNFPTFFDLYGTGWNTFSINRYKIKHDFFGPFKNLLPHHFSSYKGKIGAKKDTLSSYKFSFCLENAINVPGWITEKLFDSLFNGCIPIYYGASEIETYVDKGCFIDYRNYSNHQELYEYLSSIDEDTYTQYIENIRLFLNKKSKDPQYEFGIPYFIETIKRQIIS